MLKRKQTYEDKCLQASQQELLDAMREHGPDSPEFPELMTRYERIDALRHKKRSWNISADTLIISGANILVAVIVVAYEQRHVVTTKAPSFLLKQPK